MMLFHSMLRDAATKAGIKVPDDAENYDPVEYPHWHVFCAAQLGQSMPYMGVHFDNAKAIASIPVDKITTVSMKDLIETYYFNIGQPIP